MLQMLGSLRRKDGAKAVCVAADEFLRLDCDERGVRRVGAGVAVGHRVRTRSLLAVFGFVYWAVRRLLELLATRALS